MTYSVPFALQRLRRLLWIDPSATEIITVFLSYGWLVGALVGYGLGHQLSDWRHYELIVQTMPVWAWAMLIFAGASLQGIGLLCDEVCLRKVGAAISTTVFSWAASLLFVGGEWPFLMAWVYAVVGLANAWAWAQVSKVESGRCGETSAR